MDGELELLRDAPWEIPVTVGIDADFMWVRYGSAAPRYCPMAEEETPEAAEAWAAVRQWQAAKARSNGNKDGH
jgi:hypothetical protein